MINAHSPDTLEARTAHLVEVLSPAKNPETGFQSYQMLTSNATTEKPAFLADSTGSLPELKYPKLGDTDALSHGSNVLKRLTQEVRLVESDSKRADIMCFSLDFRRAEINYVTLLGELNAAVDNGASAEDVAELVETVRNLNEALYGKPKQEIVDAAVNELWELIDEDNLDGSALQILDELKNGFTVGEKKVPPFMRAADPELRLPRFEGNEAIDWAGEHILNTNSDIEAFVASYWEAAVDEKGTDYTCPPEDIVEVFQNIITMRDPEGKAGVSVKLIEAATSLSWESPEMAIHVGSNRDNLKTKDDLFRKVMHEFGVHGQRAIEGLKTDMPVLGVGLFTDTESPDYLKFEEGFAGVVEKMFTIDPPKWDTIVMGHYINVALAEQGNDFRQIFEIAWRYKLLAKLKPGRAADDKIIEEVKDEAYKASLRIFRGTPVDLREKTGLSVAPLTFNKDLAYLEGSVLAMKHLDDLYNNKDIEGLDRLFKGKYDPTNPVQDEIMRSAKVIR